MEGFHTVERLTFPTLRGLAAKDPLQTAQDVDAGDGGLHLEK